MTTDKKQEAKDMADLIESLGKPYKTDDTDLTASLTDDGTVQIMSGDKIKYECSVAAFREIRKDTDACAVLTEKNTVEIMVGDRVIAESTVAEYPKVFGIPDVRRIDFEVKIGGENESK